jgi:hypothetical protein
VTTPGAGPASTGPGPMPPTADVPAAPRPDGPARSDRPTFDPHGPATPPVARDADALAEPVAAAVLACPAVVRLSAGPFGTVGTYLPGRRVTGIQITDDEVTVRVVARPVPLRTLETQVRAAVAALVPGVPVHLGVDDIDIDSGA